MGSFYLPYPSINKLSTHQKTCPSNISNALATNSVLILMFCLKKPHLPPASFNLFSDLYHRHYQPTPRDEHQQGLNLAYLSEDLFLISHLRCIGSILVFNRQTNFFCLILHTEDLNLASTTSKHPFLAPSST